MKKRIVSILLVLIFLMTLSACNSTAKDPLSDISVEVLPTWVDQFANGAHYHYDLLVTNNSTTYGVDLSISAVFYDKNGNIVGANDYLIFGLGEGETQYCQLFTDVAFDSAVYQIDVLQKNGWTSLAKNIEIKSTEISNKIIVEATNTGNIDCVSFGGFVLFYNNDVIVDRAYLDPSGGKIAAGKTSIMECRVPNNYTHYRIYYKAITN